MFFQRAPALTLAELRCVAVYGGKETGDIARTGMFRIGNIPSIVLQNQGKKRMRRLQIQPPA